jgi:hypothetical protein
MAIKYIVLFVETPRKFITVLLFILVITHQFNWLKQPIYFSGNLYK